MSKRIRPKLRWVWHKCLWDEYFILYTKIELTIVYRWNKVTYFMMNHLSLLSPYHVLLSLCTFAIMYCLSSWIEQKNQSPIHNFNKRKGAYNYFCLNSTAVNWFYVLSLFHTEGKCKSIWYFKSNQENTSDFLHIQ
jgi:hypothetical protein